MVAAMNRKSKKKNEPFDFFIKQCSKIFRFLIDDYNMEMLDPKICGFECSIIFLRYRELGITIMYEAGTAPWVVVTTVFQEKEEFLSEDFDLDYVIEERCPDMKIDESNFGEKYEEDMKSVLSQNAKVLKKCCADILAGYFNIVPKVLERRNAYIEERLREEYPNG